MALDKLTKVQSVGISSFIQVVGVVTATQGFDGNITGIITATGDFSIADKIVHTGDTNTAIRFPATDVVSFETSGAERLRVDSSGRLLVGATTAATSGSLAQYANFVLRGDTTGSSSAGIINLARGVGAASMSAGNSAGNISFSDNAGLEFGDIGIVADAAPSGSSTPGRFVLKTTASGATTPTERLRVTSDGDVKIKSFGNASNASADALQIGKTDNNYGITILSATNAQGRIDFTDTEDTNDPQGKIAYYHDSNSLQFFTNGSASSNERLRITSDGKMGVGTASPNHRLTLHNSGTGTFDALNITSGLTNSVGLQFGIDSASNVFFWHTANGGIKFATNNVERMRVTNNGITFNGDTAAANALDDYEEGSWNPQILGWNGSYSIQEGRYIKIGRMVHIIGEVSSNANAGNSFTNSWPGLSNLPFANTTSFQGVSGSQRCMGYATIIGDISPDGTNGQGFVTFDRNSGTSFFPNHISSQGARNFQNTMINNPTTANFGYRFNCTYYTD